MEKINIYVPENIGAMIESDATMFEVYKKDGRTINKNRFLGMLIIGYYNDYVTYEKIFYNFEIWDINGARDIVYN